MSNTVSMCMIIKNEKTNIARLLHQVCPIIEDVVVVDTGSTDGTLEIMQGLQKVYSNLRIEQFNWIKDFGAARNYSFSLAKPETAFFFWSDGDDFIDPVSLKHFKDNVLDDPNVDCWILDYIYSKLPDGSPQTILGRERFIRKTAKPLWIGAIHEVIDINAMRTRHYYGLKIEHDRTGKTIDHNRNTEILETEFKKHPRDPRTAYYYGKELFDKVDPKGIEILEHFVSLNSGWYDDRVNACFRLGKHYLSVKRHRDAIKCAEEIYHLDFSRKRAEGYWLYGATEMELGNFEVATKWFDRCLDTPPEPPRVLNMEYYTWNPAKKIAECYQKMGQHQKALEYARRAMNFLPGDVEMSKWANGFLIKPEPKNGQVVLQFYPGLNSGVYVVGSQKEADIKIDKFSKLPLADQSVDRILLQGEVSIETENECYRVMKPGGILVSNVELDLVCLHFGRLIKYDNRYHYVRVDPSLPKFSICPGDEDFGPYRIQIENLRKALVKKGHIIDSHGRSSVEDFGKVEYHLSRGLFSHNFGENPNARKQVLFVCEWLPDADYDAFYGISKADYVLTSSLELAKNLKAKYPNKSIIEMPDHFELPSKDWSL